MIYTASFHFDIFDGWTKKKKGWQIILLNSILMTESEAKCFLIATCVVFSIFSIQQSLSSEMVTAVGIWFMRFIKSNNMLFWALKMQITHFSLPIAFGYQFLSIKWKRLRKERERFCKSFFRSNNSSYSFILKSIWFESPVNCLPLASKAANSYPTSDPINFLSLAKDQETKLIASKWEMFIH